jgi:hypothetical protein
MNLSKRDNYKRISFAQNAKHLFLISDFLQDIGHVEQRHSPLVPSA